MEIVNDEYWLGYAKKSVDDSAHKLNEAAGKISTLTATFWGLYTTTFAIGTALKKLEEPWYIMLMLASPIGLMIGAYVMALWAQMPRLGSSGVDLRIPEDIRIFYNANVKFKKTKLKLAMAITVLSAAMVAFSLTMANFTHEKVAPPAPIQHQLMANIIDDKQAILVIGDIPNKTVVTLQLEKLDSASVNNVWKTTSMAYKNNHFEYLINLPKKAGKYKATVTWDEGTDPKLTRTLIKPIEILQTGKLKTKPINNN